MIFTLRIQSDDAALTDAGGHHELQTILQTLAQVVVDNPRKSEGAVFDSNGNKVGRWSRSD
jgi:hypothetical protein